MTDWLLDASALLAYLYREPGAARVQAVLSSDIAIGAVNLAEVVSKLLDMGWGDEGIIDALKAADAPVVPFDEELAYAAGLLRAQTRHRGLSLGDRACLALARRLGASVLTADRAWAGLDVRVPVEVIR